MIAEPAVWFPAVRTGTGSDVFTETLVATLNAEGLHASITWLPLRAEYAPLSVSVPTAPDWATLCHVNSWLHPRFIPQHLPVVATLHHAVHDPALRPHKGWLRAAYHSRWIASIERRVLQRADRVVAVSRFAAATAQYTLCNVPMQVIHNGIDTELFQPGALKKQPERPFRILYVGGWKSLKGVDLLVPVMRELGNGFKLHFTGGSKARDGAGIAENMHDLGRLSGPQVADAMREADVLLFPSRSEGFGLVAVEAMACGLPVVGVRGTAVEEVVENGVGGLLCPPDDVRCMVAAIRRLAGDAALHLEMRRAAREAALRFSTGAMVDAYIGVYRGLLAGQP